MRDRAEVNAELTRLGRVAQGIQARYGAYIALHQAACLHGDYKEAQEHREQVHTVVDALLDNGEAIQRLVNEADALPPGQ